MSGMFDQPVERSKVKSVEWYTPKWIFDDLNTKFDLDPCSPHDMESMVPARTKYTLFDDGLKQDWFGKVWLNPPYGKETPFWMNRMISHNNGIALCFSRTDTQWFQNAMKKSSATLLIAGRIQFIPGIENQHKKSRSGAGTVLFSFGNECSEILNRLSDRGIFIKSYMVKS